MALEEMPDLVLCDVMMPVKDGFDVCRELKNDPRTAQLPIVMLTAKVESEDVITGIEAGADDYITKPFDVEILQSKISSLMKKRDEMRHYFTANAADSSERKAIAFLQILLWMLLSRISKSTSTIPLSKRRYWPTRSI